jgi:16S rRNA (guanine527-N7)-methyltransferase
VIHLVTVWLVDMNAATAQVNEFRGALRTNAERYDVQLSEDALRRLCDYYELLLAWNSRLHLVGPCPPTEFATRHVLESLLLLPHLQPGACIADIGSGAGLPIIPNLIARPDIHAALIESSQKKCVFLREALRNTETAAQGVVIAERFENLPCPAVDYVTCRALDRFTQMFPTILTWSTPRSTLLLFGGEALRRQIERVSLKYSSVTVPDSERRYLFACQNRLR